MEADDHDLVQVWLLLQARVDNSSIVREILGHFALEVHSAPQSFSWFVWIKVIFDLQRTYSQAPSLSPESSSYLLPPRILFRTIHNVLVTRARTYLYQEDMAADELAQRYFAAQVLLSGIRALQLRGTWNDTFTQPEMERVRRLVENWLAETRKKSNEHFILMKCQTALWRISRGPQGNENWHKPACGLCDLRDNTESLYGTWTPKSTTMFESRVGALCTDEDVAGDAFWALFDILWAAEVGHIQWRADKISNENIVEYNTKWHDLVERLDGTSVEGPSVAVLRHRWHDYTNPVLRRSNPVLPSIQDSLNSFHCFLNARQRMLVDYKLEIRKLSVQLQTRIETWIRQESAYGESEELRADKEVPLETAYVLRCPKLHVVPEHVLKSRIALDGHVIFNNPKLLNIEKYEVYCPRCSPRSEATIVAHARMIEPLEYLSGNLRNLTEVSITPQPSHLVRLQQQTQNQQNQQPSHASRLSQISTLSHNSISSQNSCGSQAPQNYSEGQNSGFASPFSENTPLSLPLSIISNSPSLFSPSKISERRRSATSGSTSSRKEKVKSNIWFLRSNTEKIPPKTTQVENENSLAQNQIQTQTPQTFKNYSFSPDGKKLILWDSGAGAIWDSEIPTQDGNWPWRTSMVPGVRFATGAGDRVAGISQHGNLLVFSGADSTPILDMPLEHPRNIRSIAMSVDGNYVAVGSEDGLAIFDVRNKNPAKKQPFTNVTVNSQRVNFSRDGAKVVAATRRVTGQIEICLYDRLKSEAIWPINQTAVSGINDGDHGLSAVFYEKHSNRVVLSAYINDSYHLVHCATRNGGSVPWPSKNGKIQAAAQYPSGKQFVFLDAGGKLYHLDPNERSPTPRLQKSFFSKYQPDSKESFVALAAPEDGVLYAFWVEKGTPKFEVSKGQGKAVKKAFRGPMQIVE